MPDAAIPVDLFNPGQVFACLGFIEAAEVLCGNAMGSFDWTNASSVRFLIRASGKEDPICRVLRFVAEAEVVSEAPYGSRHEQGWKASWGGIATRTRAATYPFPDTDSSATLPAVLRAGGKEIVIDHWGDDTRCDNVKFWAGSGGYPGSAFARDAIELIRERCIGAARDPFALGAPQSSSFRLDWRRDYIAIDAGFSLNAHDGRIETMGYPLVELLGALGLARARPVKRNGSKLEYRYGVIGRDATSPSDWFSPAFLRAALSGASLPFPSRSFRMLLGWPGKEGQARAITTVIEETVV